jgi:HlyD family secretion protein
VKIRFFVPEPRLGAVRIGGHVAVACDGCGAPMDAAITFVAPQAEYTPPVIYSKDSRAKMVFLVEARPSPADAARLHPGQPVDVTLR